MIRLPIPTSHSESSYSKLVGSPDLVVVGVVEAGPATEEDDEDDDGSDDDETGRAGSLFFVLSATSLVFFSSPPAAAAVSGPDSFIGPDTRRRCPRLQRGQVAQPSAPPW